MASFDHAWLAGLTAQDRQQLFALLMGQAQPELVEYHQEGGRLYARAHSGPHAGALVWQVRAGDLSSDDPGWIDHRHRRTGDVVRMLRIHGPFGAGDQHCPDGWVHLGAEGQPLAVSAEQHEHDYEEA